MEQQQYKLRNIYILSDFNPKYDIDTVKFDTIIYEGMYFLTTRHFIDPDVLASAVYMVRGALYSRNSFECTMNRFYDLGVYKFANSRFKNVGDRQLDFYFYLQPAKKYQFSPSFEFGTVESAIASGVKISYQSRNVIHRANNISLSLVGGIQVPAFPVIRYDSIFYNISAQLDYTLPKFAIPFLHTHITCFNNPITKLSFRASLFQQTNNYSLQSYGVTYSLEWKQVEFPLKKFIFPILGINYVFPTYSDSFARRLANDPFLAQTFSEQFIQSIGAAFVFSNQRFDHPSNYSLFRVTLETAGNMLYLLSSTVLNLPTSPNGHSEIFGVEFANYVRSEVDIHRYLQLGQNKSLVLRFSPGIAVPYGNARVVPYIKQFYLGGTNSMRAWHVRSLGPGSFRDTTNSYTSAGDIKLEGNAEYRFGIFGSLKGALFADAGNIWLLRSDTLKPGGTFKANTFLNQIAIGTGFGFRWDFSYFVLRLDIATPVYDSSLPEGEQWPISTFQLFPEGKLFGDMVFQFAVGYPF
jgi:outer membrane protein assembly factor BamA